MNSTVLYALAAAAQIAAIIIGVVAYKAQQSESDKTTDKIISHQDEAKKEVVASQETATQKILKALQERNESLREKLWGEYPFGYVLFGGQNGDFASIPFYRGDLQVEADWSKVQIKLDTEQKIAYVKIPQPNWKQDSGPVVHIEVSDGAYWSGNYAIGKSIPLPFVHVKGQPMMYFEVIDDNQRNPIYAVGFKKID